MSVNKTEEQQGSIPVWIKRSLVDLMLGLGLLLTACVYMLGWTILIEQVQGLQPMTVFLTATAGPFVLGFLYHKIKTSVWSD